MTRTSTPITRPWPEAPPGRLISGQTVHLHCVRHDDLTSNRLVIISDAFSSKMQPARHRMIYALLRDEMAHENGIHALQLKTLTPDEEQRRKQKAEEQAPKDKATDAPISE